ncbi:MAG TPA: CNNM domain-containing protein, partial [Candidatus Dormibacteraeota bacterium]|nr:CNNM domain-containing protein [Candidatus Dormibacteraeota bacterium]
MSETLQQDWPQLGFLVLLVVLAAFFAASEAALISISKIRARTMLERGLRRAEDVVLLLEDRNRFLTSVLVANTIVLLAADSLATYTAIKIGLPDAAVFSTVLMTIILLLFGEIIPKTLATSDAERWSLRLAPAMRTVSWVLTPVSRAFLFTAELIVKPFGIKHPHQFVTEEDIRTLVDVGAEQRVIEDEEREMIHSVIEFGDTIVREVMQPRPNIVAVSVDDSPRRALDVVISEGYSKLPVFQESK